MTVCEGDARVGGAFHWAWNGPDGQLALTIRGVYREVMPVERIVHTESMEMAACGPLGELLATLVFAGSILLLSATLMYLIEGQNQPEKLGSIPRAMWWSISTLTTVGYGDVYPETPLGKVLAGVTALAAIGVFALPTGVLAAAFADAFRRHAAALRQRAVGAEGKQGGGDAGE